jgi:hypothetical protein
VNDIQHLAAVEDKYVALVSGLRICANDANPLQFQLLVDYLTGYLGDKQVIYISSWLF